MNEALARHTDPSTSHEAAAAYDPEPLIERIQFALADRHMTTHDITAYLNQGVTDPAHRVQRESVSPRMKPLMLKGKVWATSVRRQNSIVYALVPPQFQAHYAAQAQAREAARLSKVQVKLKARELRQAITARDWGLVDSLVGVAGVAEAAVTA